MHITFKQVNIFLQAKNKRSDRQKMKQEWPIGSTAETKQQKQVYLREQIIDAGYDPEQFIRFLNAKLDIDSDLDKCTIKDLEEVVVDYRQRKERQAEQLNSYFRERQTMNVQPTICQKSNSYQEPERVVIRTNPQLIEEQYKNVIKCVKITDKYQNKIKQISCQVNNPERKFFGGILGIGTTSYLCFDVWSYGLSKQPVCRRYSDFIWLRNTLLKFYPSEIIPPIPNKKAHKRLPRQIKKRMRILTMFLNDLIKIPTLMNNKYVEGFLLIKDHSKFETMKEQAEKKKPYESMLSAQTLTGKVQLQISNKTVKYKDGLNRFVPQAEHLYKQITRNSKKMKNLTMQKINLLYEMANQFGDLYSISNKFNVYIKDDSTSKLNQIYAILNNMLVEWGNSLKKEMQEVEKNMCTFFKYVREEFMGFNQLMQRVQGCEQSWVKQKEVLEKQKQKIFLLKDPRKWELHKKDLQNLPKAAIYDRNQAFKIMLPKESVHVQTLKQNYAFYLSQLYQHGRENFDRCSERYCENFRQFSIKMKVSNQQIGAMWTEVSYKFSDPYKKPPVIQKMQMQKYQQSQNQSSGMYQD